MSPLLATYANGSARGYGAFSVAAAGDFESIATVTVGSGGAANVEFTNIGTDWTHLQIRAIFQESSDTISLQFNSDTGNNYNVHYLEGDGNNASAGNATPSKIYIGRDYGSNGLSSFGVLVTDILDYSNTNKYTTVRSLTGSENNTVNAKLGLYSGLWRNTSAVTSIKITSNNASNLAQYSHFALYGIKSA